MAKKSIASAYVQIIPTTDGITNQLETELGGAGESAGESAGNKFGSAFKKIIVAAGIAEVFKSALSEGSALQQSIGGIETLYKDSADKMKAYAADAFETAGLSANEYMEQSTSFAAALISSLGGDTDAAAEAANTAITDMSDNANKFGTDIESIQNAYQGFAKQNYTMLDNLKLGFAGTKEGMLELLDEANKINAEQGKITNYSIGNLSDVYEAIHVIQEDLGVTGTTAKEASTTFSGSLASMKAAAQNVLANMTLGEDITASLSALVSTGTTFIKNNLLPMVQNIITAVPSVLTTLITELGPQLIPMGVEIITSVITGLSQSVPDLAQAVAELVPVIVVQIVKAIPQLVKATATVVSSIQASIVSMVTGLINKIADLLSPTINRIKGFGKRLVEGLVNGIKNMKEWLVSKIKEFTETALTAIKDFFGIHSPSTKTAWMGKMLTEGLASGITDNYGTVENAVTNVTDVTLSGFGAITNGEPITAKASTNADVISAINRVEQRLSQLGIYLDGDTLVGGIVNRLDDSLGQNAQTTTRLSFA